MDKWGSSRWNKKKKPYRQTPAEDRQEISNIRKWGRSEERKHPTDQRRRQSYKT